MSLDSATDPLVFAIEALLPTAVNAELQATLGENAIGGFVRYPAAAGALSGPGMYPAMMVWRLEDRLDETEADYDFAELSIFRLDYYAPPTPIDALHTRWPLLRAVWVEAIKALMKGGHPDVSAGANVLKAAGLRRVDRLRSRVRYLWAPQGEQVVPGFQAELALETESDFDIGIIPPADLDTLRLIHNAYRIEPSDVETEVTVYPPLSGSFFDVSLA
jgi:hypothetical protein